MILTRQTETIRRTTMQTEAVDQKPKKEAKPQNRVIHRTAETIVIRQPDGKIVQQTINNGCGT